MRRQVPVVPARFLPTIPRSALRTTPVRVLLAALALVGIVAVSDAAQFRRGERVTVGPDEIVIDDLYVTGSQVTINGTVLGDLVVAGSTVVVRGPVRGAVIAAGGRITLAGPVGGTVRAAGGRVSISGTVGQDAVVAGGRVQLEPSASIRRDLVAAGGYVAVADTIGDDAFMVGEHLRLEDGALVTSNLDYGSKNPLYVGPTAGVMGTMRNHSGKWKMRSTNPQKRAILATWHWTRGVMGLFLLGLLLVAPFPGFARRTLDTLGRSVFASLLTGLAMLVLLPFIAAFLLLLGILVGGWWLGLFAFALWLLALLLGHVIAAIVVGRWTVARLGGSGVALVWTLLLGLIVLALIRLIPMLGLLVACVATLLGLGALTITVARRSRVPAHTMAPQPEALAGP